MNFSVVLPLRCFLVCIGTTCKLSAKRGGRSQVSPTLIRPVKCHYRSSRLTTHTIIYRKIRFGILGICSLHFSLKLHFSLVISLQVLDTKILTYNDLLWPCNRFFPYEIFNWNFFYPQRFVYGLFFHLINWYYTKVYIKQEIFLHKNCTYLEQHNVSQFSMHSVTSVSTFVRRLHFD